MASSLPVPSRAVERPQHLCLDAGYDGAPAYQEVETRHYVPPIRSRGEEKQEKVLTPALAIGRDAGEESERIHGSIVRVGSRYAREKKGENYLAFLHLACAQLIFAKILVFG